MSVGLALSIAGIVAAIGLGNVSKLNIGLIALIFAFFLGVFGLGMKIDEIINLWPVRIMFFLIAINLLFSHAIKTGMLDLLSQKMIYAFGGNVKLFPFIAFLISGIIDFMGAGGSTTGIVAPFLVPMMVNAGLSPILAAVAICGGCFFFGNQPINGYGGLVSVGLLEPQYGHEAAVGLVWDQWIATGVTAIGFLIIMYFVTGAFKAKKIELPEKPGTFNKTQRTTLIIIVVSLCFMFFPTVLNMAIPGIAWLSMLATLCQPQAVMICAAVLCMAIQLVDHGTVFSAVPSRTIIQVCGMCVLVGIATQAGFGDWVAGVVSQEGFPIWLIPAIITILAGFLTYFSTLTAVVMPLIYAVVPAICAATGLSPVPLLAAVWAGGCFGGMSPYSLGGALIIGSIPDQDLANKMVTRQLIFSVVGILFGTLLSLLGVWNLLPHFSGL